MLELRYKRKHRIGGLNAKQMKERDLIALKYKEKLTKNLTQEEIHLGNLLKELQLSFEYQKVIYKGSKFIIVDIYVKGYKTIIEIDGSQHFDKEYVIKDLDRDDFLQYLDLTVVRISNSLAIKLTSKELLKLITDTKFKKSDTIPVYYPSTVINFGKHQGRTLKDMLKNEKFYLIWMYRSRICTYPDEILKYLKLKG